MFPESSLTFLLTRLLRGVTISTLINVLPDQFLLTRLLRGVTRLSQHRPCTYCISTHTPLARRDCSSCSSIVILALFLLTRLLRGVTFIGVYIRWGYGFLLTRLLRGVTCGTGVRFVILKFLLTRLLRGVTSGMLVFSFVFYNFYSHASCEA